MPDKLLTEAEEGVLLSLVVVWSQFLDLPEVHPDDVSEFRFHIHALQNMIMARPVERQQNECKAQREASDAPAAG